MYTCGQNWCPNFDMGRKRAGDQSMQNEPRLFEQNEGFGRALNV